jgi:hypothetical protein
LWAVFKVERNSGTLWAGEQENRGAARFWAQFYAISAEGASDDLANYGCRLLLDRCSRGSATTCITARVIYSVIYGIIRGTSCSAACITANQTLASTLPAAPNRRR